MSSFYSTNLRKSQKSLGSPAFDIFNVGKLAEQVDTHKEKLANATSDENAMKSLKEEAQKLEEVSSDKHIKNSLKKELQKTKDEANNLQDMMIPNTPKKSRSHHFHHNQKPSTPVKNTNIDNDNQKPITPVKNTNIDNDNQKPSTPVKNTTNDNSKETSKEEQFIFSKLFKNSTNPSHKDKYQKRQFFKKVMNFIQEQMQDNEGNAEILKIKSLIHPNHNKTNAEILKIKSLIHPKKSKKNVKQHKKANKTDDKVEPETLISEGERQKLKKTVIKELVNKTETKIKEPVHKSETKIKARFNTTEVKEPVPKTEKKIKEQVQKTEKKIKALNKTEIKEVIVKKKLKNKIKSQVEEKAKKIEIKIPAEIREEETLNNKIKEFASKSLQNASDRLKKEITAELQKESAEDTKEKVVALFKLKIEKFAEDFQNAANELKAEISTEILNESDQKEILEKAIAVKILENVRESSIEEKEQTAKTLKKIVFQMMKNSNTENDYAKKVLARAFDKVVDLKNQEVEKNNSEEKLRQAIELDADEKEKTFESLREAKDEAETAIDEIGEERVVIVVERNIQAEEMKKAEPKKRNLRRY